MESVPQEHEENKVEHGAADEGKNVGKFGSERPIQDGGFPKISSPENKDLASTRPQVFSLVTNTNKSYVATNINMIRSSSKAKDMVTSNQEDHHELESTRTKMEEMREENSRLKTMLSQIVKDYQSLHTHFLEIARQGEEDKNPVKNSPVALHEHGDRELVSLSLGTSNSGYKKEGDYKVNACNKRKEEISEVKEDLALGLNYKFGGSTMSGPAAGESPLKSSSENSSEETTKVEEAGVPWPPSKILKDLRNGDRSHEVLQQTPSKKARVSVRVRCDQQTMNDGCQWRKYGQKIAKGNPCPKAYYRCTVAPGCSVRKQVQRCAQDMSILITTYEGKHNHPLPISATAMASTTSAAASMLMSGSSTSQPHAAGAAASAFSTSNLPGLTFTDPPDNTRIRQLIHISNPSISTNHSHPTITLDLTSPVPSSSTPYQSSHMINGFSYNPKYPPTSFNFSTSSEPSSTTSTMPAAASWSSSSSRSYGSQQYNNQLSQLRSLSSGKQYSHHHESPPPAQHTLIIDTIAKEVSCDPSFQSALAAAITSYVGARGTQLAAGDLQQFDTFAPYTLGSASNMSADRATLTGTNSSNPNGQ